MSEKPVIDRRKAIKTVAVGVGSVASLPILGNVATGQAHQHHIAAPLVQQAASTKPKFFNKHQYTTITELASLIIPTDETPGAREAQVNEYIDMIAGDSPFEVQKILLDGLAWLDQTSRQRHKKDFAALNSAHQIEILTEISNIRNPTRDQQVQAKFFKTIKDMTIDGFYTSKIGLDELGYKGNTVLDEFPGCTHPEHQA